MPQNQRVHADEDRNSVYCRSSNRIVTTVGPCAATAKRSVERFKAAKRGLRDQFGAITLTRTFVWTTDVGAERQVCWMAESSQLPPRDRMKVHNSVTSLRSPPSTMRLLARSTMLSLSANFIATVA